MMSSTASCSGLVPRFMAGGMPSWCAMSRMSGSPSLETRAMAHRENSRSPAVPDWITAMSSRRGSASIVANSVPTGVSAPSSTWANQLP